jgi:hypothetical protein
MTAGKHRLREQAVAALLTEPTLDRAARQAGVSEKTLRRWMHEDEFRAVYAAARRQALGIAVGRLQGLLAKATEAIDRALACGAPAIELRAAVAVFEHAVRGAERLDLEDRIAALERRDPWT